MRRRHSNVNKLSTAYNK